MAIRNILVAYNGLESADSALRLGLLMARKYDAHVTGLFAYGVPAAFSSAGPWLTKGLSDQFREIAQRAQKEVCEKVEASFRDVASAFEDPERVHWMEIYGSADRTIIEAARNFDITLLGQFSPATGAEQTELHPDVIALMSGKPVLIVPRGYAVETLSENAVLAWDGKRAASRAMSDAMQILETKDAVRVVTVDDGTSLSETGAKMLVAHLERHGIRADAERIKRNGSIARSIVDYCARVDAGLLVMGAYEHSKFSEDLVGGVTNDVLKSIDIPVLMAH